MKYYCKDCDSYKNEIIKAERGITIIICSRCLAVLEKIEPIPKKNMWQKVKNVFGKILEAKS